MTWNPDNRGSKAKGGKGNARMVANGCPWMATLQQAQAGAGLEHSVGDFSF